MISLTTAPTIMTNIPKALPPQHRVCVTTVQAMKKIPPVQLKQQAQQDLVSPHLNNMTYKLPIWMLGNVTMAHIHQGKEDNSTSDSNIIQG